MNPRATLTVLLLAGGRSARMGRDKALLTWNESPLWRIQLEKLQELKAGRCLIACREEQALHQETVTNVEWLFDLPNQDCGPMGPIARALDSAQGPLLVLAVDMPFMTVPFLNQALRFMNGVGLFFRLEQGIEPLAGIYAPGMSPLLKRALQEGRYSLRDVIEAAEQESLAVISPLSHEDAHLFANTNTPDEWERVRA